MAVSAPRQRVITCSINGDVVQALDLVIETETIDASRMSNVKPDPKWEHVDAAGHFHAYAAGGKTPTLQETGEEYWCEDCHDHHTSYATRCTICAEEVRPGTINHGPSYDAMPGPATWTLKILGDVGRAGDRVSVRLQDEGRDSFGIMHVGPARSDWSSAGPGRVITELVGFLSARMTP